MIMNSPKSIQTAGNNQDSKFRKLNMKAEEKKVNIFYLKDLLIKESNNLHEKMEALFKIKKNIRKPVFALAMKSLLQEFQKISDVYIQREVIYIISCSNYTILIKPLQDLQKSPSLDLEVKEDIEDAIQNLQLLSKFIKTTTTHNNNNKK